LCTVKPKTHHTATILLRNYYVIRY